MINSLLKTFGILSLLTIANDLCSQVSTSGSETLVNTVTAQDQKEPAVAMDSAGNYIVVWASQVQDGMDYGVYFQRYNNAGSAIGSETLVNTTTNYGQRKPDVAMRPNGSFVITWQSYLEDTEGSGVWFALYDNTASLVQMSRVNDSGTDEQKHPTVAMRYDGFFVVGYSDDGQDGNSWGVSYQGFSATGIAQFGETVVNTTTTGFQGVPDVAIDSAGNYTWVWQSENTDGSGMGVFMQRYDKNDNPLGTETQVNTTTTGNQQEPSVAADKDGNTLVCWSSYAQDGDHYGIYGQLYNSSGVAVGGEIQINTYTADGQDNADVSVTNNGTFFVSWTSFDQDGDRAGVYMQGISPNGSLFGTETMVHTASNGFQQLPAIASYDNEDDLVVVWQSGLHQAAGQDGDDYGVYMQRFGITDNIDPVAACQNINAYLDGTGNVTISGNDLDNGSTDNVGISTYTSSITSFTCANLGANAVTLTVADATGNTDDCAAVVTVLDTTSPVASCQNITVFLDGTGNATIATADIDNGSSDNCGSVTLSASSTAFTCANVGANNVTLTVTDGNSNTSTCVATVTVIDTISPVATCQNVTVFLDGSGNATIAAADIDNGSSDNCGSVTLSASATAFTCANVGTNNVTLTVTDGSANTSTCIATVTVTDSTSPVASCQNVTVFLDGSGNATIAASDLDNGSSDNCSTVTFSASQTAFTCANVGPNNVTLTATDGSSNTSTCIATVTVSDTTSPVASCQNVTVFLDGTGNATIAAADIDNGSNDNCGSVTLSASTTAFTCANVGANNVTLTVTDGNANTSTCVATVTVDDTTSPVASCQNITVFLDGTGNATLVASDIDNGSSDNCGSVTLSASTTAFSCANLGVNNVTLTATDGSSNTSTCVATITVSDTTSPVASCQNVTVFLDGTGNATLVAADIDNGSIDNCGAVTLSASSTAFTCANIGPNNVTLTVTDGNSNTSTCVATVTVSDTTSPVASCQNVTVFLDGTGNATIAASDIDNGSSDNCGSVTLIASTTAFTCANVGANNVTLTVTDGNSNTSTCLATVTVSDTISPVASCQNVTVFIDGTGNATIVAADIDNGSSDNCGAVTFSASQTAFTCANLGTNNITLTVTDGSANTSTCTATATVSDTISPVVTCPGNQTETTDAACNFTLPDYTSLASATDNCGGTPAITQSPLAGTVISGTTSITMTADDGNGNASTCTFSVTLTDATAPAAVCQNITAFLDGTGNTTIVASDLDGGSTDNCSGITFSASQTAFTCADIGANNVTLTVTDGNSNADNCVAVVTVSDTISPIASCQNITVFLDGAGTATIVPSDLDNGSTDNCSAVTLSASTTAFTCADIGANNVTLTVTDGSANTSSCLATVTVSDTISPVASCQNVTVFLDGIGNATIAAADIDNGSNDNCGSVTLSASTTAFTCADIGANNVTLTVTDGNANTSTCVATVTVSDTTSPVASCQNVTVFLDGSGNATIAAADIDGGSSDNCSGITFSASQTAFTCANLGTNNVTLTVSDGSANTSTCIATVTVADTISPIVTCPGNQIETTDAACNFALPDYISLASATDNCGGTPTIAQSPVAGTVISGTTSITMTADDGNGNTSTCTFNVTLTDATAPTAVCQNITAFLDGAGTVTIAPADLDGGSTDNCSGITFGSSQTAFTCANLGTNNVTLTVTDGNSNTNNCVAVVTVVDSISPTAICQNISVFLDVSGNATIVAADIDNGSTDNCGTVTLSASTTAFTCSEIGANNVILTVDDGNGNTSTCTTTVTVIDTISPTAVCQNINAYLYGTGNVTIVAAAIDGGSTDNCGTVTLSASTTAFTCAEIGTNNVTLTVTDGAGNTASCVGVVTVIDTVSPTAVCQNINAYLDGAGNATIVAADIDGGSTDNCGAVTLSASATAFTCANLGTNNVTLTVTDGNTNSGNCIALVTVVDTISPVVTCPGNQTENPDAACNFTLLDYTSLASATDNCGGTPTITQSPVAGTVISATTTTITMTADDGNGNSSTCTFDVVLNDLIAPTITCPVNQDVDFSATCDYALIDFTGLANATDNCSGVTVTQSPVIGTVITTTTTVTLTATDGNSNTATCVFDVIPADNTAPTITCPADQNELADANCEFTVPDYITMTTGLDNCSGTVTITQSPAIGSIVTVGSNTITMTAADGNGNTSDCTFTLNVTDNIAPIIACAGDQSDSYDSNCSFTLLDYTSLATVTDNCGTPSVTQSPAVGTSVTASTLITLTADDGNGNTVDCSFNLTLSDTTAPIVECPSDETIYLNDNCEAVMPDLTISGNIYDNCDNNIIITQSIAAGTVYNKEETVEVTLIATDVNGNSDSCSLLVSVAADENSGCIDNLVVSDLISPNGDGKNDYWIIHETSYIIGCTVYVYNRWGQQVFEAENYDNTWGATYNGEKLPDGAYYYVIVCDGEAKYTGDISILSLKK
ncbi:MAG: gliding motility-associated-like protein [Parvicella sp.]|jgi:gliding motility-associated-like protein